jgi:hypothetical protein
VAAFVATNSQNGDGKLNAILKLALALAREVKTGQPTPELHIEPVQKAATADETELLRSVGHYATVMGDVELSRDDDQLAFLLGDRHMRLKPLVDGAWGVWAELWGLIDLQPGSMSKSRVRFEQIRGRRAVVADTPRGSRFLVGIAYEPTRVTAAWKKRVGMYRVVAPSYDYNLIESIRLYVADSGQLMAEPTIKLSKMPVSFALRVLDDHTVVSEGIGRNLGMRMTADENGDLYLAGLRFRGVDAMAVATGVNHAPRSPPPSAQVPPCAR